MLVQFKRSLLAEIFRELGPSAIRVAPTEGECGGGGGGGSHFSLQKDQIRENVHAANRSVLQPV